MYHKALGLVIELKFDHCLKKATHLTERLPIYEYVVRIVPI